MASTKVYLSTALGPRAEMEIDMEKNLQVRVERDIQLELSIMPSIRTPRVP